MEFRLDDLKNKIEIVAYMAKTVLEGFKSRSIMDLEVFALLAALHNFHKYISNVPVTLLTDNKALYYLFNSKVGNSSTKIRRWCLKLLSDYPNVTLRFVKTTENLADFLTREGLPPGDCEKLNLKQIKIEDFKCNLPKDTFTLAEWAQLCHDNPQYLSVNDALDLEAKVLAVSRGLDNVQEIMTPIKILRQHLSRDQIIAKQKVEYDKIYTACLSSKFFEFIDEHASYKPKYRLITDLLMTYEQG